MHFLKSKSMMAAYLKATLHVVTPHCHLGVELLDSKGLIYLDNRFGLIKGTPCPRGPDL